MCQAVRDGGRRCPKHQHGNVALQRATIALSNLTERQVDQLFSELRREGRNSPETIRDQTNDTQIITELTTGQHATAATIYQQQMDKATQHNETYSPETIYARNLLLTRARTRHNKITEHLEAISQNSGIPFSDIKQNYARIMEEVDTSRGSDAPTEYNATSRMRYFRAELPCDRATVVALERLSNISPETLTYEPTQRIQHYHTPSESNIHSYGYDAGRLEVKFREGGPIYSYRNVPEHVWNDLLYSSSPGRIIATRIRNNPEYQYETAEQAENDATQHRCQVCGQFIGEARHICPEGPVTLPHPTTNVLHQNASGDASEFPTELIDTFATPLPNIPATNNLSEPGTNFVNYQLLNTTSPTFSRPENITPQTPEQQETELRRIQSIISAHPDKVENIPQNTSITNPTTNFTFNTNDYSIPDLRTFKTRLTKQALRAGKAVYVENFSVEKLTRTTPNPLNPEFHQTNTEATVTGPLFFRRTKEGAIELLNKPSSLKCDCPEYAQKYVCEHTLLTHHQLPYYLQTITYEPTPYSQTTLIEDDLPKINPSYNPIIKNTHKAILIDEHTLRINEEPELDTPQGEFASNIERLKLLRKYEHNNLDAPLAHNFNTLLTIEEYKLAPLPQAFTERHLAEYPETKILVPVRVRYNQHAKPIQNWNKNLMENAISTEPVFSEPGNVTGELVYSHEETRELTRNLKCDCETYQTTYRCQHVRTTEILTANKVFNTQTPAIRNPTPTSLTNTNIQQQLSTETQPIETTTPLPKNESTETGELMNPPTTAEAFWNIYQNARKTKNNGTNPIPLQTENVTNGICAPGKRKFGIEIEYDYPQEWSTEEKQANDVLLAKALQNANLTQTNNKKVYHASKTEGYATWTLEHDPTTDGEIVSPPLSDTPESWEQINKICAILKKHNAMPSTRTGLHVNISSNDFNGNFPLHAQISQLVRDKREIIFRLAKNPEANTHRGTQYCNPNVTLPYMPIAEHKPFPTTSINKNDAVNFTHSTKKENPKSRIEYRMWDATLDPATIQQQVAISANLTEYAHRAAQQKEGYKPTLSRDTTPLGGRQKAEQQELKQENGKRQRLSKNRVEHLYSDVREFLDTVFTNPTAKENALKLFAINTWYNKEI